MTVREQIIEAFNSGETPTVNEIVEATGVSRQRVYQLLAKLGLSPRPEPKRRAGIRPKSRISVMGPTAGISHSAAGTISELIVAADLTTRGWTIFFPLVRTAKCDLIALSSDGQRSRRIEVRSGRRIGGSLSYNKKPSDTCDHYAVVLPGEETVYLPEIELGA
jgi:hypothetical protein